MAENAQNPAISVVIPVYNEELVINESYKRLKNAADGFGETYELIFVNDGSRDKSYELLKDIASSDHTVRVLNFSRNFGHQPAITAGMEYALGEAIVVIDADLQDPPEVIIEMIKLYKQGYDVVYGKRGKRQGETFFKKFTAKTFYRILRYMTSFEIPVDTGDFRLISRRVCEAMKSLGEKNRFIRGLVSWVGYKQTSVEYVRDKRFAGETKYPISKMVKLALDGIISFSYKPLKFATGIGFFMSFLSFLYMLWVLYERFFTDKAIQGWASTIAVILFTQGLVLMILGIIGEYIGRIFDETKNRPLYIISDEIKDGLEEKR